MLESIVNGSIIYYIIGGIAVIGILTKMVVSVSLNRLVKAASNMSKSSHGLMRLVKAKFEHAHMLNDKVENTQVFVDKYIQEYKVMGMSLYTWQWLERLFLSLVGCIALVNVGLAYYLHGPGEVLVECFGMGGLIFVGLAVILMLGREKWKFEKVRVYMVDYLENICGLRYARDGVVKEKFVIPSVEEVVQEEVVTEASRSPMTTRDLDDKTMEDQRVTLTMVEKLLMEEAERREALKQKKTEEHQANESTIREILQEFMA